MPLQENHVISWSEATVLGREPDRETRWIKEAVCIRKEKKIDEPGRGRLHTESCVRQGSCHFAPDRGKIRKKKWFTSSVEGP